MHDVELYIGINTGVIDFLMRTRHGALSHGRNGGNAMTQACISFVQRTIAGIVVRSAVHGAAAVGGGRDGRSAGASAKETRRGDDQQPEVHHRSKQPTPARTAFSLSSGHVSTQRSGHSGTVSDFAPGSQAALPAMKSPVPSPPSPPPRDPPTLRGQPCLPTIALRKSHGGSPARNQRDEAFCPGRRSSPHPTGLAAV
jgi:hypothetical protein